MISLLLAAFFFVGIHVFVSGTSLRAAIVEKTGEPVYQTAFSLVSLLGLIWLGVAYAAAEPAALWEPAAWLRPVTHLLTLIGFLFVAIGVATPSPTAVGGEAALSEGVTASGILRITRHPFLWGVALWAVAHLLVSAELASLVFFGSLLLLALVGPPSIDAKRKRMFGEHWTRVRRIDIERAVPCDLPGSKHARAGRDRLVARRAGAGAVRRVPSAPTPGCSVSRPSERKCSCVLG